MLIYVKYIILIFLKGGNMAKILADNEGTIVKRHCKKCDYFWIPRTENSKQCPRCKNIRWKKGK